ncbi:MAG: S-layer homology domain-containing protein [Muribaculaceae bacterium]|nr:S-layer homology domain-containing protein [Muribaculaceae bacterium]
MSIKKLTVAAAIAVGIATCSLTPVMAACPCNTSAPAEALPVVTGPACPIETPQAPTCNKCKRIKKDCGCKKKNPCPVVKEECGCKDDISCDKPAVPSTALCPQTGKPDKAEMKQVYGYPQALYGSNNYVGEPANSIFSTETAMRGCPASRMSSSISGATVATDGQMTGAATQMPCLNECPNKYNGIFIDRNECRANGASCPIDIQTSNSINAVKKTLIPYEIPQQIQNITGAAAPFGGCMFPDVPNSHWAACDIDKLAVNDVVVGYPDGLFKPNRNISRAEFATMLVKGFNLNCGDMPRDNMFTDVPRSNWANPAIAKAVDENLLKGYPNNKFRPNAPVTRVEALTSIAKGMTCDIDQCKADEILSRYADGNKVPDWAKIPVAKSLENGALKDSPTPNMILPNKDASRADVASMMQTVRVALGYDTNPKTANNICPACPIEKNALVEHEEIVKIPTLQLSMIDQITAKSSHVGQYFRANTLEDVTINGVTYPCGSTVTGQVVEVIRPSGCEKGALKLAFTDIKNGDCKTKLPKQILQAQINKSKNVNPVARLVEMPFTWAGSLVGVVGRTAGGIVTNLGNAVENVSNDAGYMLGHAFQGQFGAASRNLLDGVFETVKAPVDITRTALSGTMGLFQTTGDEFAYLVDPRGYKISAVNPREHLTIAFGCNE